jgi:probable HAF family extracellular repeat protein
VVAATGLARVDPFLWANGHMTDLGTLGGNLGQPFAMNDLGVTVGYSDIAGDQDYHPFLWNGTRLIDLGTLGGSDGEANAVNDLSEIVGDADTASGADHAFLWADGKMHDLLTLGTDTCSIANSINLIGQIVGDSGSCDTLGHAFISENGGKMMNLDTLVVEDHTLTVTSALFIDNLGEIACRGTLANGDQHACLLVPVLSSENRGPLAVATEAPRSQDSVISGDTAQTLSGTDTAQTLKPGDTLRKRAHGLRTAQWLRSRIGAPSVQP